MTSQATDDPIALNGSSVDVKMDPSVLGVFESISGKLFVFMLPLLATSNGFLGVFANVINLIVFRKQGFKETITMSFTALACADLLTLIFITWLGIVMIPYVRFNRNLPFAPDEIIFLVGSYPRDPLSRASSLITAYISTERCFCVVRPLQVKQVFTKKVFASVMIGICLVVSLNVIPVYYSTRFTWKINPYTNKTYLGIYHIADRHRIYGISLMIDNVLSIVNMVIVSICTIVLVVTLQGRKRWLNKEGQDIGSKNKLSSKDRRAAKTVIILASIFIICYMPNVLNQMVMATYKEYNRGGRYEGLYNTCVRLAYTMEGVCASVNIFVYYNTSTTFKANFLSLFGANKPTAASATVTKT